MSRPSCPSASDVVLFDPWDVLGDKAFARRLTRGDLEYFLEGPDGR